MSSTAAAYDDPLVVSTQPIGSPFFRHLAHDLNLDLKELVKLEKRGFGRAETITLVLISSATGKPLKDLAKRRLKERVSLRDLTKEFGMEYELLHKKTRSIKETIEIKGEKNLPPPVFETPSSSPTPVKKKRKKDKTPEEEGVAGPSLTPSPEPKESETQKKQRKSEIDL